MNIFGIRKAQSFIPNAANILSPAAACLQLYASPTLQVGRRGPGGPAPLSGSPSPCLPLPPSRAPHPALQGSISCRPSPLSGLGLPREPRSWLLDLALRLGLPLPPLLGGRGLCQAPGASCRGNEAPAVLRRKVTDELTQQHSRGRAGSLGGFSWPECCSGGFEGSCPTCQLAKGQKPGLWAFPRHPPRG